MEIGQEPLKSVLKEDIFNAYWVTFACSVVVLVLALCAVLTVAILLYATVKIEMSPLLIGTIAISLAYLYEQRLHVKKRLVDAYVLEYHVNRIRKLEQGLGKPKLPTNAPKDYAPIAPELSEIAPIAPKWTPFVDDDNIK